jgi:phosphatidylserine/phosphatidylglycerophosphate/cardiolipin synthase-like enzyme
MKTKICFFILFLLAVSRSFTQSSGDIELVESIPVETALDNPDIRNTQEVWLEMINSAKSTLDIEQFYVTNKKGEPLDDVLNAIITAAQRGVKVRIIVDSKMFRTYPDDVTWLEAQSPNIVKHVIDFGRLGGGIQHAKYFVVDTAEVFLGSQNFDWRALKHIHELGVRVRQSEIAVHYKSLFECDWDFCEQNDGSDWRGDETFVPAIDIGGITVLPCESPMKLCARWDLRIILDIINNAKSEVDLQFLTYKPETKEGYWGELDDALKQAAGRGVKIKLIVSDWSIGKGTIESLQKLSDVTNIEVKYSAIPQWSAGYIPFARVEHLKYVTADEACWIGSANAEKSYFYNTRNVGVEVISKQFQDRVMEIFYKDWNGPYTHQIISAETYMPREHGGE